MRESPPAQYQRPRFIRIAYAAVGLTLFAAYLISTFPYFSTLTKVLAPMGLEVSSTSQSASFPFGARLSGVRLTSTRPASAGLLVESPAVTIAPSFLSMLTMHPGVRVKAALYDGIVNVILRPGSRGTAISYDLDSVEIARQQLWTIPGASAAGALSGSGNLLLSPDDIAENGEGILSAAGLTFTSAFASSPIRLGCMVSTTNVAPVRSKRGRRQSPPWPPPAWPGELATRATPAGQAGLAR